MSCESINSSLFTFPCSQPPPAPLPDTPATAVTFAFDGDGAFTAAAAANVGEALNLIDDFLACLQPPCEASEGQVYLADSNGQMRLVDSSDLVSAALSDLLPGAGQFLYNAGGVVAAVDFCTQVQTCLNNLATSPGQVLMSTPSGIAGVDLCSEVQNCLGNLTGADGQFLIQQGGALTALDHCQAVQSCLASLLPANGSVLTGNGLGGVTATNLCQEVMDCLDANSTPGTFFLNNGGNVTATDFVTAVDNALAGSTNLCDQVEGCFGGALDPGEVYYNSGAGTMPTNLGALLAPFLAGLALNCVEVQNCLGGILAPGQVYFNNGAGIAPTDIEDAVSSALGLPGTPGEVVAVDGTGNNVESRTIFEVLDDGAPAGISGQACTPEILLNEGTGWRVGKGITEAPTAWAFGGTPSSPQSHPLQLEVNTGTGCPEWQPRDHVYGTFTVPGDFPTLAAFTTWAQGKSLNVNLNYSGTLQDFTAEGLNGVVRISVNSGGSLQNIHVTRDSNLNLLLSTPQPINTLLVEGSNSLHSLTNLTIVGNRSTTDSDPSRVTAGLLLTNGASATVSGSLTVNNTGGQTNVFITDNSALFVDGTLTSQGSSTGVAVEDGAILHVSALSATGATVHNVKVARNGTLTVTTGLDVASGSTGLSLSEDSSAVVGQDLNASANTASGVVVDAASSLKVLGYTTANQCGVFGVASIEESYITLIGGVNASQNGFAGVFAAAKSNFIVRNVQQSSEASNNGSIGFYSETGSTMFLVGPISTEYVAEGNVHGFIAGRSAEIVVDEGASAMSRNNSARGLWVGSLARLILGGSNSTPGTVHESSGNGEGLTLGPRATCLLEGLTGTTGLTITGNNLGVAASTFSYFDRLGQPVPNITGNVTNFNTVTNVLDANANLINV